MGWFSATPGSTKIHSKFKPHFWVQTLCVLQQAWCHDTALPILLGPTTVYREEISALPVPATVKKIHLVPQPFSELFHEFQNSSSIELLGRRGNFITAVKLHGHNNAAAQLSQRSRTSSQTSPYLPGLPQHIWIQILLLWEINASLCSCDS